MVAPVNVVKSNGRNRGAAQDLRIKVLFAGIDDDDRRFVAERIGDLVIDEACVERLELSTVS